jgi:hypothetical protein
MKLVFISYNFYIIGVIALKDLKIGDELFISYVDECLEKNKRLKILKDQYLFDCNCEKCLSE